MKNSRSQTHVNRHIDRSHSQRLFYVNDQLQYSKDISTIFHSPFKDGKRNTNFTNPTFLSSSLFYGQQQAKKQLTPKHNLVYNKNQRSRKQLYDKRMQKADNLTVTVHQAVATNIQNRQKSRKANDQSQQLLQRSRSRIRLDKSDQLSKQLQILLKYRQNDQKKQKTSRIYIQANRQNIAPETPIYIQKNRLETEEKAIIENKKNLQQWIAISDKIKKMKDRAGVQNKKIQTQAMDHYILDNGQRRYHKEQQSRRNAGLLANILREQIRQSQIRKEQQRKQRASFY